MRRNNRWEEPEEAVPEEAIPEAAPEADTASKSDRENLKLP